MDMMLSDYGHWPEYDSVALAVLFVGVGLVELIVLSGCSLLDRFRSTYDDDAGTAASSPLNCDSRFLPVHVTAKRLDQKLSAGYNARLNVRVRRDVGSGAEC
jgi:hypothetical protein